MNLLDVTFYRNFHLDLKNMNLKDVQLIHHFKEYGHKEGRMKSESDFYKTYPTFDLDFYSSFYDDLSIFRGDKYMLMWHFHNHGLKEGRQIQKMNPTFYREFHLDIKSLQLNDQQLNENYLNFGKKEGRLCCEEEFYETYPTFDLDFYSSFYDDLSIFRGDKYMLMWHYHNCGLKEGRSCFKQNVIKEINYKEEYRNLCLENINYLRKIDIPDFQEKSNYESVLIEYRCLPHLEFLIRNAIIKLGEKWCHTIICGNLNYDYMIKMCLNISKKIKIIKTNYDNLFPSDYSKFLSSLDFWNLLDGEKILIYQEDTCIFKNNIDDFLHWDYIGAPWPENQNDNNKGVGNGGLSLRTKSIMKKIIECKHINDTLYNKSTLTYIKNTNSSVPPEDVYFTKNIEDLNIGLLADRESALNFSTECIVNKESFGGHQFWLNDPTWKNRIYENIIIKLKPEYEIYIKDISHRGGWKDILLSLDKNSIFDKSSNIHFYDTIEIYFLVDNYICEEKWCGIMHWVPNVPDYLNKLDIEILFQKENFLKSLKSCIYLVSLSNYLTKYLKKKMQELNLYIPIYTLKHPVVMDNIPLFNYNEFRENKNKKIIQIGLQLRKVTSIYLLNAVDFEKLWLTGTDYLPYCDFLLDSECKYLNIDKNRLDNTVKRFYTKSFEEYDDLLSKNIVFVDLFDAAANNTVLECIIRNTPIIINKIEPVVDYLGEDYPLYFNNLDEIPNLLTDNNKILAAHEYLCKINKSDLSIDYFVKKIMNINYSELKKSFKENINCFKCREDLCKFIFDKNNIVCVYSPYEFSLGGGEKYLSELMNYFLNKNFIIIFFNCTDKKLLLKTIQHYLSNEKLNDFINAPVDWLQEESFIDIIKKNVQYFIHMNNSCIPKIEGFAKTNLFHCQFPFDINNNNYECVHYSNWDQQKKEQMVNSFQHIVVNSEFTKQNMEKVYLDKKINFKQNINVLYPLCYNGTPSSLEPKENIFLMIGRIFEHNTFANNKRFDIAIEVFNQLSDYNYKLVIIGSVKNIDYYNKLQELIKNNKNIEIIKDASDETKNKWLAKAKYFIQLTGMEDISVCSQEHFGISLIEALSYNCIPICFNGGYAPNIVKDNHNGYLINNREELKNTIENLIKNSEKIIINNDFNLEKYNKENYLSIVKKIM